MGWGSLVTSLLAEEEKASSSVGSPCCVVVGRCDFLATEVAAEALGLNGLGAEVEELLLGEDAPAGCVSWMSKSGESCDEACQMIGLFVDELIVFVANTFWGAGGRRW